MCAGGLLRHDSDSLAHHMRNPLGTFCYSSSEPGLGSKRSSGSLLWDSAHAEALASAMQVAMRHPLAMQSCKPGRQRDCARSAVRLHAAGLHAFLLDAF